MNEIEIFEENTGLTFEPNGPRLSACEHCGQLVQYYPDHSCAGIIAESAAAAWFEDAAYGTDSPK